LRRTSPRGDTPGTLRLRAHARKSSIGTLAGPGSRPLKRVDHGDDLVVFLPAPELLAEGVGLLGGLDDDTGYFEPL
jgi:hypothetical protein